MKDVWSLEVRMYGRESVRRYVISGFVSCLGVRVSVTESVSLGKMKFWDIFKNINI